MNYPLPDHRYGMTQTNYNLCALPASLPERDALDAANKLNHIFYTKLTHRQRIFVSSYIGNNFDGTKAAIDAGYDFDEADRVARSMLKKPPIIEAIQRAILYFTEKEKLKFQQLLDELKLIALSNMGDFFKNDGHGDPYLEMPQDGDPRLRAISEIQIDSYFEGKGKGRREVKRMKFKMHDKLSAIDKLLKILDPKLAAAEQQTTNNVVNVQTVNIVAVPTGQFIPAPEPPQLTIAHNSLINQPLTKSGSLA